MRTDEFDYSLPAELIAQHPERERSLSRLLVFHRKTGEMVHRHFSDIVEYFTPEDILVLNESKVFPARLWGRKETGGAVEILLTDPLGQDLWGCLVKGAKRAAGPFPVTVGETVLQLRNDGGAWTVRFPHGTSVPDFAAAHGVMPLPPYIKRGQAGDRADMDRYQTVYARVPGSIAAPTAWFHFTGETLEALEAKGVTVLRITLHIGTGTFLPVRAETVEGHRMHSERYSVAPETKRALANARAEGKRIVACGTSSVRTLETLAAANGNGQPSASTDLFIYPGYRFRSVDALITNFHLPRSTPLLLAAAFARKEGLLACYREAIARGYRFYSYGDGMLIL